MRVVATMRCSTITLAGRLDQGLYLRLALRWKRSSDVLVSLEQDIDRQVQWDLFRFIAARRKQEFAQVIMAELASLPTAEHALLIALWRIGDRYVRMTICDRLDHDSGKSSLCPGRFRRWMRASKST
jgi:hypothetical protein